MFQELLKLRWGILVTFSLLLFFILNAGRIFAQSEPALEWWGPSPGNDEKKVSVEIISTKQDEINLKFTLPGVELHKINAFGGYEAELPGEGHTSIPGSPSLPKISRLIAIPFGAEVSFDFVCADPLIKENFRLLPTTESPLSDLSSGTELYFSQEIYQKSALYPADAVEISPPAIWRHLNVLRITINPLRYNPVNQSLFLYPEIQVRVKFKGGNAYTSKNSVKVSPTYYRLYQHKIVNFKQLDLEPEQEMGSLVIIAPDDPAVLAEVQPLVDWKNRKGFTVVLADLSQTGSSSDQIKAYLQNAYDTWEPQLTYLILIGDCAGAISVPPSNQWGDHDYSRLAGDDILSDIAVGRFSCAMTYQLTTEVNKVIGYESNPYMAETAWYKRAAVTAPEEECGFSTIQTKQAIRFKVLLNDYTQIDTLWYTMGGSVTTFTTTEINTGIGFYNYRGYLGMIGWGNSNINNLINYNKLPFVVTITCQTGDITGPDSEIIEEFFRVGTPVTPKGAIGAIGTATDATHTRHNNCVDNGIFGAFYDYGIFGFGDALNMGKFDLYMSYPDNPSSVEDFSNWNNLIGDPGCQLWTDIPKTLVALYPDTLPVGASVLSVTVLDSITNNPLAEVQVCLNGNGIHLFAFSDEFGQVNFILPPVTQGEYELTCCLHNYKPHLGRIYAVSEDVFLNWVDYEVDDDTLGLSSGNDDGNINPGETIELGLVLKNFGDSLTATEIVANLLTSGDIVNILDSTQVYPDLSPQSFSELIYGFCFSVQEDAVHQYTLPLDLEITALQGLWTSPLPLMVYAPDINFSDCVILDSNGQLDPGEESSMQVEIINSGGLAAENLEAMLACENAFITILQDNSFYGDLDTNQSAFGQQDFILSVSPAIIPGTPVTFNLIFTGENGFQDTAQFNLTVGTVETSDPSGPDDYGYYALDNTDVHYSGHPDYNWVEIDPTVPGHQFAGLDVGLTDFGDEQDDTILLHLPFIFTYYGQSFSEISVCSNGWLAMGNMTYFTDFRNWYIPSTLGPYSLIAPFWDDLYLIVSPPFKVYAYYDQDTHRFIVEWNVKNRAPTNPIEKFEAILFDPASYPTASGDGEIIFQYQEVHNVFSQTSDNHFSTVGIKSPDDLMGLEYSYWNHYDEGAAELDSGLAVKFTTEVPERITLPVIEDLTIIILNNSLINLDWNDVSGAVIYYIYRSPDPYFNVGGIAPYDSTVSSEFTDNVTWSQQNFYYRVTWRDNN